MKTFNVVKKLGLGLALTGLFAWQARAEIEYSEYSTVANPPLADVHASPSGNLLGNVFDTSSSLHVTGLGAYSFRDRTFGTTGVSVGLYELINTTWTRLAQASFTGVQTLRGNYAYHAVDLTLAGGGTYAIVASGYGTATCPYITGDTTFNAVGGTTPAGYGLTLAGSSLPTSFSSPTLNGYTYGAGTIFAAVPEAADFALAAVALLGLVYVGRLYSQKLKLA
ncbi:MAG: hypothetical protein ABSE90_08625 [Verrucomicrobiota bacterium]